ncbi:hypothetical protein O9992_02255 [Vibrio lentus]|nr:hypothetical protein [Vibrio lentus]
MTNFETYPAMWAAPILGVAMPLLAVINLALSVVVSHSCSQAYLTLVLF